MLNNNKNKFSRRGFLGAGFLLPFLSVSKRTSAQPVEEKEEEFITMLTAKGGVVRVRKSAISNAKVVEKKMSNKSLFNWLKLNDNK